MSAERHPAYQEEKNRLEYTLGYVNKTIRGLIDRKRKMDEEVDRALRHFDSADSDSYTSLMVNTLLQDKMGLRLRNLDTARFKPYFARIDFKESHRGGGEQLYIGKMSLMREEDQEVIIVDWRAPVANLYYEGRLGKASYQCPEGEIAGELMLKRQFAIDGGVLQSIFDIDITTNDEFLQSYLGANADNRLKDIVSTIQEEQNKVVRADMWMPLIVQGVAGSGKTTIALHRIAYLIYTYEKSFHPENFMIIAPNRLFLNYISEVLPELGVERVKQTTFEDFALEWLGEKLKVRELSEKLINFVDRNMELEDKKCNQMIQRVAEWKSSIRFKELLDRYFRWVEASYLPREDFLIGSQVLFRQEEIQRLFMEEYGDLPLSKRMDRIQKHLKNRLKRKKESIIHALQEACDREVENIKELMEESEERREWIVQVIDEKNERIEKLDKFAQRAVKDYLAKVPVRKSVDHYKSIFQEASLYDSLVGDTVDAELKDFIRQHSLGVFQTGTVEMEDLAPILYLKFCIDGVNEKIPVQHIVIDEAQDLSVLEMLVLKSIIKDSSFTILGDLSQGIYSYRGTRDWQEVAAHVFQGRTRLLTLEQSYRTSIEIMEAAKKVLGKLKSGRVYMAKPVIRHGEAVEVIAKGSFKTAVQEMGEKIVKFQKEGLSSIAIIGKTMEECRKIRGYLKKEHPEIQIITGREKEYKGGVVVVPSYLVKGLEFDVVMIANASRENYEENEMDIKLLYVAMTRPLHKLHIYYCGELSPLLR